VTNTCIDCVNVSLCHDVNVRYRYTHTHTRVYKEYNHNMRLYQLFYVKTFVLLHVQPILIEMSLSGQFAFQVCRSFCSKT